MINNYINVKKEKIIKESAEYLYQKYGQKFKFLNFIGQSLNFPSDRIGFFAPDINECFTVFAYVENGKAVFRDSYFSALKTDEYKNVIEKIVSLYVKNYNLEVYLRRNGCNPKDLCKETEVENICNKIDGDYIFYSIVTVCIKEKMSKKKIENILFKISEGIAEKKLMCRLNLKYREKDGQEQSITFVIGREYIPVLIKYEASSVEKKLSNSQIERLCIIVYLNNLLQNTEEYTLGEIMLFMKYIGISDNVVGGELPCEMTREEWDRVIDDILDDRTLSALIIKKYVDISETDREKKALGGHRAVCFMDNFGNSYVIFRGTAGDTEWYDNAIGMIESDTPLQKAAAEFVKSIRFDTDLGIKHLVVGGHSKGGNKAQYSTITLPDNYIDKCFVLNGHGFSNSFLKKYTNEINRTESKIYNAAERRDFVNCLGYYIKKPTFYNGRRGNYTVKFPCGEPLPYFHCPDALREDDNKIGEVSETFYIPKIINEMTVYFLGNNKYKTIWEQTSISIVSLMMRDRKDSDQEITSAIINVLFVFFELIAKNKNFYNDLITMMEIENDVLLATAFLLAERRNGEVLNDNFKNMVVKQFASALQKNPINIAYILNITVKFIAQIVKISKDDKTPKTLYILICSFISELFNEIITEHNIIVLKPIYKSWLKLCKALEEPISDTLTIEKEQKGLALIIDEVVNKFTPKK